jgi:signal-transduction protein with cAMP-binding, CBS, and nucleotidyltransferase domain
LKERGLSRKGIGEAQVKGDEETRSLASIEEGVRTQLGRLGFGTGEEYVAGVRRIVEPLQARIDGAREELGELVARAGAAPDTAALRLVEDRVVSFAADLFRGLHSAPMVHEFCTTVRDAVAERALELARQELYFSGTFCDVPVALLAVGSDGRREELLFTDQDYLFLHGAGGGDTSRSQEDITDYFGMLGSVFVTMMEEIGIGRCRGGIMPVNDDWRGSMQQWRERLAAMCRFERSNWEKNILNLIALMDTRFVCGDRHLGLGFGRFVRSVARDNPDAMRHMSRVVSSMRLSRGFLRRFVVEAEGDHKGEFDIKVLAWMPLVMCIRLLAVNVGIEETSTLGRIDRLRVWGHLSDRGASDLVNAYHVITGHRITQQIRRYKRIIDDDCYINPHELPGGEREALRSAIGAIDELQNTLRTGFSVTASIDRIISPGR